MGKADGFGIMFSGGFFIKPLGLTVRGALSPVKNFGKIPEKGLSKPRFRPESGSDPRKQQRADQTRTTVTIARIIKSHPIPKALVPPASIMTRTASTS
jgi:hypothetical protein